MKKNIYKLLKLYESFSDLFDDDILGDEENTGSLDSDILQKITENDLKPVIIDILGIDKPHAWKYEKDKDGKQILTHESKVSNYMDAYGKKVINQLKDKGFTEYKPSNCPYAFTHGLDYIKGMKELHPDYQFPNSRSPSFNSYLENIKKYNLWVTFEFPKMPEIAQDIFKKDYECSKILLSKDEGVILIEHKYNQQNSYKIKVTATIKLTGKVVYDEKDSSEQKNIIKNTKDRNNRISFLQRAYKKLGGGIMVNFIKYFDLDKNNEPYGIIYFNWDASIKASPESKEYNIPIFLLWLLSKNIYPLNELEKDDDNAVYELTKNGITFYFYKDIDTSKATDKSIPEHPVILKRTKPDSCLVIKLTDYLLEQYHEIFG